MSAIFCDLPSSLQPGKVGPLHGMQVKHSQPAAPEIPADGEADLRRLDETLEASLRPAAMLQARSALAADGCMLMLTDGIQSLA